MANDFLAKVAKMRAGAPTTTPASGVADRMSVNAGSDVATKSGKGHFAAIAQQLAKARSGIAVPGALTGSAPIGGSKKPTNSKKVNATEAQSALNAKQQGASFKHAQTDGHDGDVEES